MTRFCNWEFNVWTWAACKPLMKSSFPNRKKYWPGMNFNEWNTYNLLRRKAEFSFRQVSSLNFTWALASETDPVLEESEHTFLYLSIVVLTLQTQKNFTTLDDCREAFMSAIVPSDNQQKM